MSLAAKYVSRDDFRRFVVQRKVPQALNKLDRPLTRYGAVI
jgi:hypothetical protein